jgi:hypothetical protein
VEATPQHFVACWLNEGKGLGIEDLRLTIDD